MKLSRDLLAVVVAVLLVACAVVAYLIRDAAPNRLAAKSTAAASLVDARLLQTARQLAATADSSEEQDLAREALRLSDHELDQAFASALRETTASTAPPSGPLKQLGDRVVQLKTRVTAGQARIQQLTKAAATSETAADQLELAKAQLALDQDELEDAQQDLARRGGDKHANLERALQEHEAVQKETVQLPRVSASGLPTTLLEQARLWFSLANRDRQLQAAGQQTANRAANLEREHDALEALLTKNPVSPAATSPAPAGADEEEEEDTATLVARLRGLSDQRKTLTELDKRIQDSQQLSEVYKRWNLLLETRQRSAVHHLLTSLAWIFGVLLTVILLDRAIRRLLASENKDRGRRHQLRIIATITVQFLGALGILFIVFGVPNQVSTVIGLVTAGLTVALKDFIVGFFGWFALLGRNGIRIGDWVEIEGVSGEVLEIGLLRTVLLEMGNWTNTSHPTGRRVTFVNSFAIEGHYFNFSTAGQWLWDELQVFLPVTGDPYQIAQQIREAIERETEAEAKLAEEDWQRVTHQYGLRSFSAKPAVDLRPSANGLRVIVRYITRAPQRYEVKSRLFQTIGGLLHKPAEAITATPAQ
jgi:small-conductance mechanosensitive channel